MIEYKHTAAMGEISGFGGDYEATCQNMLHAGVQWLVKNTDANPEGHSFKGIYGVLVADNTDAKAMEAAVMAAPGADGCTGAMHHAVMSRLLFIAANGWDKYCTELVGRAKNEARK